MSTCGDYGGRTADGQPCGRRSGGLCYLHLGDELTGKQRRFVEEYLVDLNATQAAIRAGYSENAAAETGYENLRKPHITAAIQAAMGERAKRTEVSADKVIRELAKLAFSEMDEFSTWGPNGVTLRSSDELDPVSVACISEVSETTTKDGGSLRFKLHSKTKALELLGKHLALFTDRVEHSGSIEQVALREVVVQRPSGNGARTNGAPKNRFAKASGK